MLGRESSESGAWSLSGAHPEEMQNMVLPLEVSGKGKLGSVGIVGVGLPPSTLTYTPLPVLAAT